MAIKAFEYVVRGNSFYRPPAFSLAVQNVGSTSQFCMAARQVQCASIAWALFSKLRSAVSHGYFLGVERLRAAAAASGENLCMG